MSKKHYTAIARLLHERLEAGMDTYQHGCLVSDLADLFAAWNPFFDRARFLRACGL